MPQVTEIAYLTLKPDIDLTGTSPTATAWQETLSTIRQQTGFQRLHWGLTLESPELLILMIDWTSLENHKSFTSSPTYGPFLKNLSPLLDDENKPVHLHHFTPTPSPPTILGSAPVVEFATFYDPDPSFADSLGEFLTIAEKGEGVVGWARGGVVEGVRRHDGKGKGEEGKAYVFLVGWESVEMHMKFRETGAFRENVGLIRGNHGGVEMFHVKFTAG
ncbi:uncharacterized protein LY89DRAFT_633686 [Mollisia scopiformis]|uniref:ABM domain-containing protein n=1 Tax=Mollisia scopiformis TaxID=149040 RepID=A0A194XUR2_MOLSC|nr:uncharacterized protein LY89DRAFT_633686 [Mollisia scopiformis]KUJ23948.1 hypothetical protein LY89DRAFT_633686 [Mollisia scopiformis]